MMTDSDRVAVVDPSPSTEDKRLDRLLDYTKFHIGVYLSIGGGLVALIGAAAKAEERSFLREFIGSPKALMLAFLFMVLAGFAGGVIASCCTQHRNFNGVWQQRVGPYRMKVMTGENWALVEHLSFWISMLLFAYGVLSAQKVAQWICGSRGPTVPCSGQSPAAFVRWFLPLMAIVV